MRPLVPVVEPPSHVVAHLALIDAERGTPIEGATVHDRLVAGATRGVSDERGLVSVEVPNAQNWQFRIDAPGYASSVVCLWPEHTRPEVVTRVDLWRGASLTVHVRPTAASMPDAPSLEVAILAQSHYEQVLYGGFVQAATGVPPDLTVRKSLRGDNTVEFEGLSPHTPLMLELWRGAQLVGASKRAVSLEPGTARSTTLSEGACRLRGHVVDPSGQAVPNVEVWLLRAGRTTIDTLRGRCDATIVATTVAGPSGEYEFASVPPGEWRIGPYIPERSTFSEEPQVPLAVWPESVSIVDGQRDLVLNLAVEPAARLRGTVYGADLKTPVSACMVRAVSPEFEAYGFSDSRGAFSVDLRLGPEYTVVALPVRPGYAFPTVPITASPPAEIRFELARPAQIAGQVIDARTNSPMAAFFVCSVDTDGSFAEVGGVTDAEGKFAITQVPEGKFVVTAHNFDGRVSGLARGDTADLPATGSLRLPLTEGSRARFHVAPDSEAGEVRLTQNGFLIAGGTVLAGQRFDFYVPPEPFEWTFRSRTTEARGDESPRVGEALDIRIGYR